MEKIYYKTTKLQLALFIVTLLVMILGIFTSNLIVLAILCLVVINLFMLHFNFFIDTSNSNLLNKIDFFVQLFTLLLCLIRFVLLTN